jgi:hypothetical protein
VALGDWLKNVLGATNAPPADVRRFSGLSESALAASLQTLPAGERGWITLAEAARLFSTEKQEYAFGEMDEAGKLALGTFAAEHRSFPEYMPTEGRVYFTRKS